MDSNVDTMYMIDHDFIVVNGQKDAVFDERYGKFYKSYKLGLWLDAIISL